MDNASQKPQSHTTHDSEKLEQTAVPYIPPPPPEDTSQKRFNSPLMNGLLLVVLILVGGFMTYNFVRHQLTQLAGVSEERTVTPTPSVFPTPTP